MRTVRTRIYKFDELPKEVQDRIISTRIEEMMTYEHNDHYANWPEYKKACDKSDSLQTPWFTGAYIWDYCKDDILRDLAQYEYYSNGHIHHQ
jgi:hypothetical protein